MVRTITLYEAVEHEAVEHRTIFSCSRHGGEALRYSAECAINGESLQIELNDSSIKLNDLEYHFGDYDTNLTIKLTEHIHLRLENLTNITDFSSLSDEDETRTILTFPKTPEILLAFLLDEEEQECVVGDLTERYHTDFEAFGKPRADLNAYAAVIRSLSPLIKRKLIKTSLICSLDKWIRKLTS